jgi:hypothetical protein
MRLYLDSHVASILTLQMLRRLTIPIARYLYVLLCRRLLRTLVQVTLLLLLLPACTLLRYACLTSWSYPYESLNLHVIQIPDTKSLVVARIVDATVS